ncbi:hypothetical protein EYF80_051341 [Liparis tanakae]|uniref:Uncharacterized protein n=1 Tax=Liparis tanakae TaxID=230148 RepID=A0A4Z2FBG8_9TELE|nr:hypothetical protein EYF80_051341 [Liparis tanakae]
MADPWCWGGKPTGSGVSPATLEPNVGPPATQRLEGVQPEEELMSSLGQMLARIEEMGRVQAEENRLTRTTQKHLLIEAEGER